jgi:hypothetical protein
VFNLQIISECNAALIRLLKDYLVPKYGARTLCLLIDPKDSEHESLLDVTSDRRHVRWFCDVVEVRRRKRFQLTFVSCL